jgi:hypothetical protein
MTHVEILARRWISASRWRENYDGHYQHWMTPTGGKIYDPQRDGFTEFVVVPDDDPRAETAELYGPQPVAEED